MKKTLEEVRASINKAWVLGSEHFREKIANQLNRRASPLPKGRDRKSGKQGDDDGSIESDPIDFAIDFVSTSDAL